MAECFEERVLEENVEEDSIRIVIRILRGLGAFHRLMHEMSSPQELSSAEAKGIPHDLPLERVNKNEGQCLICLKEYVKDEFVRKMPCNHLFHSTCLLTWLERSKSCPLCRCELATESLDQID